MEEYTISITYKRPKFYRRIFANLIDILLFALTFFGLFLGCRGIVISSEQYQSNQTQLIQIKKDSGIFINDKDGSLRDIITVLNQNDSYSSSKKKIEARYGIDKFLSYTDTVCDAETAVEIRKSYDEFRLEQVVDNKPCFVLVDDQIKETGDADDLHYYKNVYAEYIDKYCQGYLIKSVPHYYDLTKYLSTVLILGEITPSYLLAGIIIYLIPPIFFRRGKMTIGKALYHIGLLNNKILNPSFKTYFFRFLIFYFGELILSLFTFGLPYIISFSMMVFSKKKQGFPDYMLDLQEVDTSKDKIFNTIEEVKLDSINPSKKPVDFNVPICR